jgi:crotonobetainyl-CoA:carnitine CoA-transferase CaiB-like acyl-CoA transferase
MPAEGANGPRTRRFDGQQVEAAPDAGQHSRYVIKELLGYSEGLH